MTLQIKQNNLGGLRKYREGSTSEMGVQPERGLEIVAELCSAASSLCKLLSDLINNELRFGIVYFQYVYSISIIIQLL